MTPRRNGYALLAALWVTVALSTMALTGLLVARDVVNGTQNRIALMRGRWRAEDCLERARVVIAEVMSGRGDGNWASLDWAVAASPVMTDAACDVSLVPTGIAVDLNAADGEQMLAMLRVLGIGEPRADSMVDAWLDWRDADDIPRPMGAEQDWYRTQGRFPPRNGPFANVRELRRVRGFDESVLPDSMLDAVFTVEPGRIVWSRASIAVLASLPGVGEEALALMIDHRSRGVPITSLQALSADLSPGARQLLAARTGELQRLTTDWPDAWVLTAHGGAYAIEVRLAPAGTRAAIVRRRTTP
jgi:general secretion pathway protein K